MYDFRSFAQQAKGFVKAVATLVALFLLSFLVLMIGSFGSQAIFDFLYPHVSSYVPGFKIGNVILISHLLYGIVLAYMVRCARDTSREWQNTKWSFEYMLEEGKKKAAEA